MLATNTASGHQDLQCSQIEPCLEIHRGQLSCPGIWKIACRDRE